MPNILTLDTMKDLSIDEIVNLYRQGYVIEDLVDPVVNFGKVTVSTGYSNLATSIILNTGDGARLPDPVTDGQFNLVWYNSSDYTDPSDDPNVEIVRVTAKSVDTLTITRAQEGTLASNKNTVGKTYRMILSPTKKTITDIDTQKVSKSGDTMTGALNLPLNGLTVGTNQLVTSGGYVGIGTASPISLLDVNGTIQANAFTTSNNAGAFFRAKGRNLDGSFAEMYNPGGGVLRLTVNNASLDAMTILSNGNVGIGTTTPANTLDVNGTIRATGIINTALVAGKLFADSSGLLISHVGVKVGSFIRDTSLVSGSQTVTGVGFKPSAVLFLVGQAGTKRMSIGFSDGTNNMCLFDFSGSTVDTYFPITSQAIYIYDAAGTEYYGTVSSLDADGFTMSWTKSGSPTGTITIMFIAFR